MTLPNSPIKLNANAASSASVRPLSMARNWPISPIRAQSAKGAGQVPAVSTGCSRAGSAGLDASLVMMDPTSFGSPVRLYASRHQAIGWSIAVHLPQALDD